MKKHIAAAIAMICILFIVICVTRWPERRAWTYTQNAPQINYEIGEEVEWNGKIYRCMKWDAESPAVMVPPEANPYWWAEVEK